MTNLTLRLGQTITPFGVGAIYDVLGQSLVACDITYWRNSGDRLRAPRLTEHLGLDELRTAPSSATFFGGGGKWSRQVPYARFPKWLFCSNCRNMYLWDRRREQDHEGKHPTCAGGGCRRRRLTPMRFIAICSNGHAMDVPWVRWAHSRAQNDAQRQCAERHRLSFLTQTGGTSGLESLRVWCGGCRANRSLAGITADGRKEGNVPALGQIGVPCDGRQPWQKYDDRAPCDSLPVVVQRGAGNVYFPRTESALDIPPWSDHEEEDDRERNEILSDPAWGGLASLDPSNVAWDPLVDLIAANTGIDRDRVDAIARAEIADDEEPDRSTLPPEEMSRRLLEEEWDAFHLEDREQDPRDNFIIEPSRLLPAGAEVPAPHSLLDRLVDKVIVATRLREIRVLRAFARLDQEQHVNADLRPDGRQTWLPAIEVFGEGIFLTIDEGHLQQWEQRADVRDRAARIERRRGESFQGRTFLRTPATARFVLLHTLSHILIRQLAFECGYASASLRERLYVTEPTEGQARAGILIYTAAGDSEGTMGGLARQGEPPRLAETLVAGLAGAAWCSTDPVCIESEGQGVAAMNQAACHACALVAETSCTHFNSLLDRELLVGGLGFFAEVVERGLEAAVN